MDVCCKQYDSEHDYVERDGKIEELTVTITLAEYRELIEKNVERDSLLASVRRENDNLRDQIADLQHDNEQQRERITLLSKALVHQCPEFFDKICDIFKDTLKMLEEDVQE